VFLQSIKLDSSNSQLQPNLDKIKTKPKAVYNERFIIASFYTLIRSRKAAVISSASTIELSRQHPPE
jgi:hypothetical protein